MEHSEAVHDVAERVRQAMRANGGDRSEAIADVADELAPDRPATIRDLWASGFGYYAVERAASDVQRRSPAYMSDDPPPRDKSELPANWGTSRYDDIDPLDIPVAVGTTGVHKRVGDLTRDDVAIMAGLREATGKTLLRQAKVFKRISMKIHEDQTLRDALPALDAEERGLLEEVTKVSFASAAEVEAA